MAGAVEYTDCDSAKGKLPPSTNMYPGYDAKQSDGNAPVMLELLGNAEYLSSFPCPLWPRVVAPDRVLSIGQIELFDKQITDA